MFNLGCYVKLLRPQQYYKNLLVFLGIIFSGLMFSFELYWSLILGFFALSFVSSTSYIINDWKDIEADRNHPEKKFRPLASGAVSKREAVLLILLLFVATFILLILEPIAPAQKFLLDY